MNYKNFNILFLTFLLFFFTSCNKNTKSSDNIIPKDKMISILTDVQMAEAAARIKKKQGRSITNEKTFSYLYYDLIFKKYNITKNDFDKSIDYYNHNINELNEIYTEVITNLNKKQIIIKK